MSAMVLCHLCVMLFITLLSFFWEYCCKLSLDTLSCQAKDLMAPGEDQINTQCYHHFDHRGQQQIAICCWPNQNNSSGCAPGKPAQVETVLVPQRAVNDKRSSGICQRGRWWAPWIRVTLVRGLFTLQKYLILDELWHTVDPCTCSNLRERLLLVFFVILSWIQGFCEFFFVLIKSNWGCACDRYVMSMVTMNEGNGACQRVKLQNHQLQN